VDVVIQSKLAGFPSFPFNPFSANIKFVKNIIHIWDAKNQS
jgi:hypothetical protein